MPSITLREIAMQTVGVSPLGIVATPDSLELAREHAGTIVLHQENIVGAEELRS